MTSLITPRRGKALDRVATNYYGAYHAGEYRGMRDTWLIMARLSDSPTLRCDRIRTAINAHRAMMRCLRELARESALGTV